MKKKSIGLISLSNSELTKLRGGDVGGSWGTCRSHCYCTENPAKRDRRRTTRKSPCK